MNIEKIKKKKVLIIQHFAGIGGSTLSCFDIVKALDRTYYEVVLALPAGNSAAKKLAAEFSVQLLENCPPVFNFTYHNASSGLLRTTLKYISSKKYQVQWESILKQVKPELVILNSSVQAPMIKTINRLGIQCICYVRETIRNSAGALGNRFLYSMLKNADGILFLTEFDKESWDINSKVQQKVIPDVVDRDRFHNVTDNIDIFREDNEISSDTFNIMYFGGFSYIKGVQNIVKAFQYLNEQDIKLFILGDDGNKIRGFRGIKRLIYHREISCVKRTDTIIEKVNRNSRRIYECGTQMDTSNWYKAADIIVFPVEKVHQARPIYEAGYYSKSVVIPNFNNFIDNMIDGYNGLIYDRSKCENLAKKILLLYFDPQLKERLGMNNRKMTEEKHNEDLLKKGLQDCIENIQKK